jgi:hypothetical protein
VEGGAPGQSYLTREKDLFTKPTAGDSDILPRGVKERGVGGWSKDLSRSFAVWQSYVAL